MRDLPKEIAFNIYSDLFWDKLSLEEIESLSAIIAAEIADTAINMGQKRAAIFLQRSLNVLNYRQGIYRDIKADGKIGRNTLFALKKYLAKRGKAGEEVLVGMLNALQGAKYIELAERREKDETFIYGWFLNRIVLPIKNIFGGRKDGNNKWF